MARISLATLRTLDRQPFTLSISPEGGQPLEMVLKPLSKIQQAQAHSMADDLWEIFVRPSASLSEEQLQALRSSRQDPTLLPSGQRHTGFDQSCLLWACQFWLAQDGPAEDRYMVSEILYILCHDDYAAEMIKGLSLVLGVGSPLSPQAESA